MCTANLKKPDKCKKPLPLSRDNVCEQQRQKSKDAVRDQEKNDKIEEENGRDEKNALILANLALQFAHHNGQ